MVDVLHINILIINKRSFINRLYRGIKLYNKYSSISLQYLTNGYPVQHDFDSFCSVHDLHINQTNTTT